MPVSENGADYLAAAKVLTEYGDAGLIKEVRADMRKAARPLGERVIKEGAAAMPRRGGLSHILEGAKMSQSNATSGRNPGVALTFKTNPPHDLKSMNEGIVRHPTFGHREKGDWKETKVKPGAYSRPFEAGQEATASEIVDGLNRVAQDIARRTKGG
jgi:hypothetical protein